MSLIWTDPPRPRQSVRGLCVQRQWQALEPSSLATPRWLPVAVMVFALACAWCSFKALAWALAIWRVTR